MHGMIARPCRTPLEHNVHVIDAEGADRIELELTSDGYVGSVARIASDGSVPWRLKPHEVGQDAFVRVEVRPRELVVTSWWGWQIVTDLASGAETRRRFTK